MKIISWNCKMAYRKKAESLLKYHPDLAIIPECEYLGEETTKRLWFGDNRKKGIGIFSYSDLELELHKEYNPSFKYVIPIKVKGLREFNLFAIWAMNDLKDVRKRYIGQVYSAITHYKALLDVTGGLEMLNSGGIKLSSCQSLISKLRGCVDAGPRGIPHVARFIQPRIEHQRDRQKNRTQPWND